MHILCIYKLTKIYVTLNICLRSFKIRKAVYRHSKFKCISFLLRFIMKGNSELILKSKEKLNSPTPWPRLS